MSGIGVVLNPRSRLNQRDPGAARRLARTLGDHGVVRTANTRDDLARIAEDFRKLEIDVLGISGGDGTNHVTITGFLAVYADEPLPPLAFLRGGTFNTVANAVGVPRGKPDGLLARLIRRYAGREPLHRVERHVMRIGDHYGFIFGTGAIYGFISDYNQAEHRNALWAAQVLLRASGKVLTGQPTPVAQRWEGKVTVDDGDVFPDRDYLAIGASTVDQIGLGFRPLLPLRGAGHLPHPRHPHLRHGLRAQAARRVERAAHGPRSHLRSDHPPRRHRGPRRRGPLRVRRGHHRPRGAAGALDGAAGAHPRRAEARDPPARGGAGAHLLAAVVGVYRRVMSENRLGRDVFLALAAVGWSDGKLDAEEADAIVRTALAIQLRYLANNFVQN